MKFSKFRKTTIFNDIQNNIKEKISDIQNSLNELSELSDECKDGKHYLEIDNFGHINIKKNNDDRQVIYLNTHI